MYESFVKLIPGQKLCASWSKCLPVWLRDWVEQTNENEYNVTDDENYDDSECTQIQEINSSRYCRITNKDVEVGQENICHD
jgi:hypothetical protein